MKDITIESGMRALTPFSPQKKGGVEGAQGSFGKMLQTSIAEVNQLQNAADNSIEQLVAGRSRNLHETMIAMEKARYLLPFDDGSEEQDYRSLQ